MHSLEDVVRLLLKLNDDVTLNHVGHLLTLLFVYNLLHVAHAFLDVEGQCLVVHYDLLAFAGLAVFLVHAASSAALGARLLRLQLHESHVLHNLHDALTLALGARDGLASLSTATLALGAVDVALYVELFGGSSVELLESHCEFKLALRALPAVVAASAHSQ